MLLGAEWRPGNQFFVKQVRHEPNETDGFVWPAPTFEFYDRQGQEITGQRRLNIDKYSREFAPPVVNIPDFKGLHLNRHNGKSFSDTIVMRKLQADLDKAEKVLGITNNKMTYGDDDHILDAFTYGMGAMEVKAPKDTITIRSQYDMKMVHPNAIWSKKVTV